jgi:hypothetical protein
MSRLLQVVLLGVVLLAGGVVHGIWSDRWTPASKAQVAQAGRRVKALPLSVGMWEGTQSPWAEVEEKEAIETIVTRRYVNRLNGTGVGVLLGCGNPRNLSMFHTPLECYPAAGYTLVRPSTKLTFALGDKLPSAEFMVSDYKKTTGPLTQYVRVFWSWSGSGVWQVPDNLRLAFGPYRVLYKVYATRSLSDPEEPIDTDLCLDFLRELLPQFNQSVIEAQ